MLRDAFSFARGCLESAEDWGLALEYELPRERGRRPDAVLLAGSKLVVLEFKEVPYVQQGHIDQVLAYARDLNSYHAGSHELDVYPVLVPGITTRLVEKRACVWVTSPSALGSTLATLVGNQEHETIGLEAWLDSEYAPLPTLVQAARKLFEQEPLPSIRRAESSGIGEAVDVLRQVALTARQEQARHLVLVTGVPGAGKTLTGLIFVHRTSLEASDLSREAVFLSGNGPLVKVLQDALKSRVFVQDVHGFLKRYGGLTARQPHEHVWVYDEAQRAWDAERVMEKRGHRISEPEDLLRIGASAPWAVIVGLIGEGQEIHLGEESGLGQWNSAIRLVNEPWTVHCAPRLANVFPSALCVESNSVLDLTESLRSHLAQDVQEWVKCVLNGDLELSAELAERVHSQGFLLYLTRDLEHARSYVRDRYEGEFEKRYGLLASSKARDLSAYGIFNDFYSTQRVKVERWYNDPPDSPLSCCQLKEVVTEFSSQGLELDMPIVCWGKDLYWSEGGWASRSSKRSKAKNPHQLRVNSYRVLLSRGRDGLIVFVPPATEHESIAAALMAAGIRKLSEVDR